MAAAATATASAPMASPSTSTTTTTTTVTVLYFAASRDAVGGATRETLSIATTSTPPTTDTLLAALVERHPPLERVLRSCVLALNQEYVAPGEGRPLRDGDEVAVVPPLSGG